MSTPFKSLRCPALGDGNHRWGFGSLDTSRFVDTLSDTEEFDVKIWRTFTTYQFTDRLLVRNISDVQYVRLHLRSEPAPHVPGQRRHGFLHLVRRPSQGEVPDPRGDLPHPQLRAHTARVLHQVQISVPLLIPKLPYSNDRAAGPAGLQAYSTTMGERQLNHFPSIVCVVAYQ